jgi:hypothetical protein
MMSEASVEKLYLEDLTPGTVMRSPGSIDVAPETIKEFARTYDPQPFHLSEEAAASTIFKGLARDWHFSFPLRAQTTIEVDTITCDQFLSFRVADPVQIAISLSGYYHGLKHDPKLESCKQTTAA